jgi:hypothetical protein
MDGSVRLFGSRATGGMRTVIAALVLILGVSQLDARTAKSADGGVQIDVPEDWNFSAPQGGAVMIVMADEGSLATLTVFREDLGDAPRTSALRYLFLKVDNFEKSFEISGQSPPEPLLIDGKEAARTTFQSTIPQPDGTKLKGAFIFTCLSDGGFLYTIVASTTAADLKAWEPVLNNIAGSLLLE